MTTNDTAERSDPLSTVGDGTVTPLMDASDFDRVHREHGSATVSCRFRCASDGVFGGRWRGVRIRDLLERMPPETTHVRVWSVDDYHATVPLVDALDAVIATERVDGPANGVPRFVGEGLDSTETVRDVVRIAAVVLPPGADPEPSTVEKAPK